MRPSYLCAGNPYTGEMAYFLELKLGLLHALKQHGDRNVWWFSIDVWHDM